MKCRNLLFNKDFFTKNYGNYIVAFFFLTQITSFIIFYNCGLNNILSVFSTIINNPPPKLNNRNNNLNNSDNYTSNNLKNSYKSNNFQFEKELNINYENDNDSNDNKIKK